MSELELISRQSPMVESGVVVAVDDNVLTIQIQGGYVQINRANNPQIGDGDSVLIQGGNLVGKVRPQASGKIFNI